jgi:Flp pilus assembly protein CpaB
MQTLMSSRLFSTRGGTMILGTLAAVLAATFVLVYLSSYRKSVNDSNTPVTVLVAKRLIEKGTPGSLIGQKGLFAPTTIAEGRLKEGAITDPAAFRGQVAVSDIYPGQQLTTSEFTPITSQELPTQINGDQRAIAVPVDNAHGLIGQVHVGDHVDVYVGFSVDNGGGGVNSAVLRVLMENALVLSAPSGAHAIGGAAAANVVIRANHKQAAAIAYAADNGKVWLVLRPPAGAPRIKPDLVTLKTLLIGAKPLQYGGFGGRP